MCVLTWFPFVLHAIYIIGIEALKLDWAFFCTLRLRLQSYASLPGRKPQSSVNRFQVTATAIQELFEI